MGRKTTFSRRLWESLHRGAALSVLLLLLSACTLPWSARPAPGPTPPLSPPVPTSEATSTVTPSPPGASQAADLAISLPDIALYPGPPFYSGDVVTVDIRPQNLGSLDPASVAVRLYWDGAGPPQAVAEGAVDFVNFDGVPRARLLWAWDTSGLQGRQTLIAWLDPDDRIQEGDADPYNNIVTFTVDLFPAQALPPLEAEADWVSTTTSCCELHYLDDTAAGRDIATIDAVTMRAVDTVQEALGVTLDRPLRLYFPARVLGHGGYAYDAAALSYLDRHYAGFDLSVVVRHEATHVLDAALLEGKPYPPAIMREGLATFMGGGHFKPEPIPQRAAALLQLGWYIPLERLADDFYRQQHEVGYLEAAAFVSYLVENYGWERFRTFYTSFPSPSGSAAEQLDDALALHYDLGLLPMEERFRSWLRSLPPDADQVRDLRDTVALFDTVRRYQALLDPGAYWLSGLLPNPVEGERRGIVADFLRHPVAAENIALETMLIAARESLQARSFERGEALLDAVNRVLDTGDWAGPLESDYLAIVRALAAAGYEAQRIDLDGDRAHVWAIAVWPQLEKVLMQRMPDGGWSGPSGSHP